MSAYAELAKMLSAEPASLGFRFGTVSGTDPLTVDVAGLKIEGVWCNESLLESPQEVEAELNGESMTGTLTRKKPLKPGDRVVLLSDGDQVFYILCKAVNTGGE